MEPRLQIAAQIKPQFSSHPSLYKFAHQAGSLFLQCRAESPCVFTNPVRRNIVNGQFARVAHQPPFHCMGTQLGMALKCDRILSPGKYLIGADISGGEKARARRQVEGIAVPMEHAGGMWV